MAGEGPHGDGVEFFDPDPESRPAARPPDRSFLLRGGLALAVAAAVLVALVLVRHEDRSAPSVASAGPGTGSPHRSASPSPSPPLPPVQIEGLGHPLLGVTAGWELFGRGDGVLVRVEFAAGRVTRTVLGPIASSGPVALLPTRDALLVRPLDAVIGYSVTDGFPPVPLTGLLAAGGAAFPGPDPAHVWVEASGGRLVLVTANGVRDGPQLALPGGVSAQGGAPDQRGGVVVLTTRGSVDVTPRSATPITSGSLVGIGPTTWLLRECRTCPLVAVDRDTGARRTVPQRQGSRNETGLVSPDGRQAALAEVTDDGSPGALRLLDLVTGTERTVAPKVGNDGFGLDRVAWSPDGRWLFVLDPDGRLAAIDARTAAPTPLGVSLPPLTQLAIGPQETS